MCKGLRLLVPRPSNVLCEIRKQHEIKWMKRLLFLLNIVPGTKIYLQPLKSQCKSLRQFPLQEKYQQMQIYATFFLPLRLYFFSFLHPPFQWFTVKSRSSLEAHLSTYSATERKPSLGQMHSSCYSHRTTELKLRGNCCTGSCPLGLKGHTIQWTSVQPGKWLTWKEM